MNEITPTIQPNTVRAVARCPRIFSQVVFELAGLRPTEQARPAEDLERMRLCRNALGEMVARHTQYVADMTHNATANVKQPKSPYFAS